MLGFCLFVLFLFYFILQLFINFQCRCETHGKIEEWPLLTSNWHFLIYFFYLCLSIYLLIYLYISWWLLINTSNSSKSLILFPVPCDFSIIFAIWKYLFKYVRLRKLWCPFRHHINWYSANINQHKHMIF